MLLALGLDCLLYADDLALVGDDDQIMLAIMVIEQWCADNNMIVNKAKSGILPVCNSRYEGTSDVNGYPVGSCYKYLGLMLNGRLDLKDHLKCINKKVNYIAYRMYALRALDDTRLNVSLFKTFAMPLYRLAYTLYDKLPER